MIQDHARLNARPCVSPRINFQNMIHVLGKVHDDRGIAGLTGQAGSRAARKNGHAGLERQDGVVVIVIDNPPVNALCTDVSEGIAVALKQAQTDPGVQAIVLLGAGRTFVAGADIHRLEQQAWGEDGAPDLHELLQQIENCPKPVVVAIHGTALGGGLELAMAGHYRVAVRDAVVGQPEVNLRIIPGAEGTRDFLGSPESKTPLRCASPER